MAGNIQGITIEFRGETSALDQAIKKVNSEIKSTDSELKKVNNALKFNPSSVELWRQKQDLLKQKISETKDKLDVLKNTQKQVDSGEIEMTAEEYRNLQREIIESESKLKTFKGQLREIGNANLKALSSQLKEIGDKMTNVGQTMTTKVTAPIVAGYTVAAKYASDYEENLNKLDVAFGSNSESVKEWANNARTEFGLSKVQATDAASAFGALGKGIGLSESEAASMSTTLAGLSADLGSYFNVGVDESAKALEGIFTGESEALKKFGVVMTDTNLEKFAADQGLVWKEMDQTQKTMLRYQYVLAKTKDAQGDFSRTSDGTANSTKIFQASIQDLATAIGTNLLPIITPIIQKITEWVNKFNELPPSTQKVITVVGLIVAAIGPVLVVLGTLASSIGSIIGLIGVAGPVIAGLAGPITLAIGVIAMLITIGVSLYKNWDTIKAKVIALKANLIATWNNIKTSVSALVNGLKNSVVNTWQSLKDNVTGKVASLKASLSSAWNTIKSTASSVWNNIKTAITEPIQSAKDTITSIIDKIKSKFPIKLGKVFSLKIPKVDVGSKEVKVGDKSVKVPTFDISWHARGGIFDQPTLLAGADGRLHGVGEAGPEAIMPISKLQEMVDFGNAPGNAILQQQTRILLAIYEELQKEKNFKVDGIWAGRYVNSLVR